MISRRSFLAAAIAAPMLKVEAGITASQLYEAGKHRGFNRATVEKLATAALGRDVRIETTMFSGVQSFRGGYDLPWSYENWCRDRQEEVFSKLFTSQERAKLAKVFKDYVSPNKKRWKLVKNGQQ